MTAMRRFEGYGVVLTGAGRGIGEVTARRLAAEGARVLVTDLDGAGGEGGRRLADGGQAESWPATSPTVRRSRRPSRTPSTRFGALDVLVSNALSCTPDTPLFEDQPDESGTEDLDITLTGAFRCARAALPHLAAAGGRGAIVNIGSVNGEQDFGNHAYSAAKAGLASLTRTLAGHAAPARRPRQPRRPRHHPHPQLGGP